MTYTSLLVPFDDSAAARRCLAVAAQIAEATGLDLDLVAVRSPGMTSGMDAEMLDRAADRLSVPVRERLTFAGDSAAAVIVTVQGDTPQGLLCMGTRAHQGVAQILFGSTLAEVLRLARQPLFVVGPRCRVDPPMGPVMACVDGSDVAAAVVEPAARLAARVGVSVCITRVDGVDAVGGPEATAPLEQLAARAVAAHGGSARWMTVRQADVPLAIVEEADARGSGVIAMATHGRTGLLDRLLGSVTLQVLHDAPCPVLVVPPASGS